MLTLGIETSCDETAVAVTNGKRVLSNIVSSSVHLHSRFGGVVPEIASRHHVEFIGHCLTNALKQAGIDFRDLRLVSVTQGPGLISSLVVGISLAKAISVALDIPIIGVNHLAAHIWSAFLNGVGVDPVRNFASKYGTKGISNGVKFPFIALVISGGHTSISYVKSITDLEPLGQTRDDACGESFDKVAKILKLGYPGGPIIEKRARKGNSQRIKFPRSYLGNSLDFSFSGIKTAVLYYVREKEKESESLKDSHINDIAAGFQTSILDVIVSKAVSACKIERCNTLIVGGGVSANQKLRQRLFRETRPYNIKVYFPSMEYCMDNAAMVAYLGSELFKAGVSSNLDFQAFQYVRVAQNTRF